MLSKKYRLPIQTVSDKHCKSERTPFFLIKIFSNNFPYRRFGVIISKKISKKATRRNQLKRIFFNVIKELEKSSVAINKSNQDFLFILYPEINKLSKKEIVIKLEEAILK